jgi:hypothetical protein
LFSQSFFHAAISLRLSYKEAEFVTNVCVGRSFATAASATQKVSSRDKCLVEVERVVAAQKKKSTQQQRSVPFSVQQCH